MPDKEHLAEVFLLGVLAFLAMTALIGVAVVRGWGKDGFEIARSTSTHTIIERGRLD